MVVVSTYSKQLQAAATEQDDLPSQVIALRDQTLVNRAGQQGDAVPAHLITEVLASYADP